MPKMKTRKAVASRFSLTSKGKLKRKKPGHGHLLTKKSSKMKRSMRKPELVQAGFEKTYKRMMCV